MKKISIIVPVYKTEKYLNRCVESLVHQTYENLEIILIDDSSPDHCPEMCDSWGDRDNRIKVLHIENKGVANARNIGIDAASGEYIGFVDSDDYAEPDMFAKLCNSLEAQNADVSVCNFFVNNDSESEIFTEKVFPDYDALQLIAMGDYKFGVLWNKLYRAEIIKNIRMPHLVCCEDLVFNYFVFKNVNQFAEVNEKLYHYIRNEDSVTKATFNIGAFDAVKSKEIIYKDAKGTKLEQYAVRGLISSCFVTLSGIIKNKKCFEKYDYLRETVLSHKNEIFLSPLYSKMDKIRTFILLASKSLYNKIIEGKNN